jgi:hypothetical protein
VRPNGTSAFRGPSYTESAATGSKHSKPSMHPIIWAAAFWQTIHCAALGYPEKPSELDKALYRSFIVNIGDVIPCGVCSDSYRKLMLLGAKHTSGISLDAAIDSGGDALFDWTVAMHNAVSRELGKPDADWTPERARSAVLAAAEGRGPQQQVGEYPPPAQQQSQQRSQLVGDDEPSLATVAALTVSLAIGFVIAMGFWKAVVALGRCCCKKGK